MTPTRLSVNAALAPSGRRGEVPGTGSANGSPPANRFDYGWSTRIPDGFGNREGIQQPSEPLLVESREVARLLGIGRTKVFELMAREELPVVRIGRCVRVPREALSDWIASRSKQ